MRNDWWFGKKALAVFKTAVFAQAQGPSEELSKNPAPLCEVLRLADMNVTRQVFVLMGGLVLSGCHTTVLPSEYPPDDHLTKLVGEGRLSHPPEYIELTVTVRSLCQPSPLAASEATDAAAAKIMGALRTKIDSDNSQDGVLSDGGYSRAYERYLGPGRTVCGGTFQKTSTIVMKSSRLATFSTDYLAIQQLVLSSAMSKPDEKSVAAPVTFATIGMPTPQLYHKTRERLEQQALAKAVDNARAKFKASAAVACGGVDYHIMKFIEVSPNAARPIAYAAGSGRGEAGAGPVELDVIWINKLLDVYFTIVPASC